MFDNPFIFYVDVLRLFWYIPFMDRSGRYMLIQNSETDEQVVFDKYLSRYKRLGYAFLNSVKLDDLFVKHITLTQKEESYKPNHLNNFFNSMRRYYKDVAYLWTAEVQEKRYEKYGDRVLHWHVMIGFQKGGKFDRDDILRIQKYWKYGNADIRPPRCTVSYLMKYIQKALDVPYDEFYKIRRIGSSFFAGWLRQSWNDLASAIDAFRRWGQGMEGLSWFTWIRGNAYGITEEGEKCLVYQKPKSRWYRVSFFDSDPCSVF